MKNLLLVPFLLFGCAAAPCVETQGIALVTGERVADEQYSTTLDLFLALNRELPLDEIVMLAIGELDGPYAGTTTYQPTYRRFQIALNSQISTQARLDALVHEYAHALAWHAGGATADDHGIHWALEFTRAYRVYEDWCLRDWDVDEE